MDMASQHAGGWLGVCVQDTTRLTYVCLDPPGHAPEPNPLTLSPPGRAPLAPVGAGLWQAVAVRLLVLWGPSPAASGWRRVSVALPTTEGGGKEGAGGDVKGEGTEALSGVLNFLVEREAAPGRRLQMSGPPAHVAIEKRDVRM